MPQRVYYYEDDTLKIKASTARYKFALAFVKDSLVLDIGCAARMGPFILSGAALKAIGADISEEALLYASKKWPGENLDYLATDAKYLPFKEQVFDCVVSFELIEHLDDYEAYLAEVKRVLKSTGSFIISTPNKPVVSSGGAFSNPEHLREFNFEEFSAILRRYFSDINIYGQRPSEKAKAIEKYRKEKYLRVSGAPVFLKKIIPARIKELLLKKYLSCGLPGGLSDGQITEEDFPITSQNLNQARHFLAVCRK
jgi:ubiquinone/menaquinone biosynthesis C-methylase UbiE